MAAIPLPEDLPRLLGERLQRPLPGHDAQREFEPQLAYGRHIGPPPVDARHAGVLILLCRRNGQWQMPLALRPPDMKTHASQVALPGGICEAGETSREAALREMFEELGVPWKGIRVLGALTPLYVFASNAWVEPWMGWTDETPHYRPNPGEVAEMFELPLLELFNPARRQRRTLSRNALSFEAPGILFGRHFIWGATSMILAELAALLRDLPAVADRTPR